MNRKDRRAAQKGKGAPPFAPQQHGLAPAALGANLFQAAVQHFQAGRLQEAEKACRDVLMLDPQHADGLHLLGMIAFQASQPEAARDLIGRSLAVNSRNPDCHFNMAQVLRTLGRQDEAAAHLAQVIALKRDHVPARIHLADVLSAQGKFDDAAAALQQAAAIDPRSMQAHYGLANLAMQRGRLDEAVTRYQRVLALKPDFAEAHNNLGVTLAAQGRWDEAAAHYGQALALRPDLVDVYRNLGRALLMQGDSAQAMALARRGLVVGETEEMRAFFMQCARTLSPAEADADLRGLITRALAEGWGRPSELTELAISLFKHGPAGTALLSHGGTVLPDDVIVAAAADPLLDALLASAPICDVELERALTALRATLLERALGANAAGEADAPTFALFSALARQCFINEYVYAVTDGEIEGLTRLRQRLNAALDAGASVPDLWLVAVAAYEPLHSLAHAERLKARDWRPQLTPLIEQQVHEPLQERQIRQAIPRLTPIEDEVSLKVRQQYEAMPYPRWLTTSPGGRPAALGWYLRNQFPLAPIRDVGPLPRPEILVAGCGTGQHAIETARRIAGARVLAIDLSLASLGYAKRKARALNLEAIDFAQADILKLGSIGRSFDLIETSGVLHHLADPWEGWRILLSLLRPRGFMLVALYSALARPDIRAARAFIAERGYGRTAADIRRCRQELLASPEGSPLHNVARFPDFFSTSECCDLLFHVQEHQLSLPEIKAFLERHGLTFIGFVGRPVLAYRQRFPDDPAATDLDRWHLFEQENPTLFAGMYQFWVQKA